MRKRYALPLVMLCLCIAAFASTKIRDYVITASTIDSTPIGQSVPAPVGVTNLTVNGAAPAGHSLCGDGTKYADSAAVCAGPAGSIAFPTRSMNTTYTNATGSTIMVTGSAPTNGSSVGNVACSVNGHVVFANQATATQSGGDAGFVAIVPAGATYNCSTAGAVQNSVRYWAEVTLR